MFKNLFTILIILLSSAALAMPAPKSGPDQVPSKDKSKTKPAPDEPPLGKFTVDVPDNWVVDNGSGAHQGVGIVFYPKGGSWNGSPAVMYVRSADKIGVSLQRTIDDDIAHYRENAPQIVVSDESGLFTRDDKLAVIKKLKDQKSGNLEYLAYVAEDKTASVITLNARNEAAARGSFAAFKALVNSYHLLDVKKKPGVKVPTPVKVPEKKAEMKKPAPVAKSEQAEEEDDEDDSDEDDETDEEEDQ